MSIGMTGGSWRKSFMSVKKRAKKFRNDLYDTVVDHVNGLGPEVVLYVMSAEMLDLAMAASNDDPSVALNEVFGAMQLIAAERGYNITFSNREQTTVH
jgi:hypothetical protein